MGATVERLRVWDAFVVRYDARAQRSLPIHQAPDMPLISPSPPVISPDLATTSTDLPSPQDDSHLSLTIALNDEREYEGGGTCFADVVGASHASPVVVRPGLGHLVAFPGALWHGGQPITRGVRYVIAAFLWVSDDVVGEER